MSIKQPLDGAASMDRTQHAESVLRFEQIVATYEAPLGRYLYGMVGDRELARDLTQETFLSAYRALPRAEITHLSGWLYRIATNHALSHLRRSKRVRWVPLAGLIFTGREPRRSDHSDWVATSNAVETALAKLDPKDRACLLLKAAGFSSQEIAEQLDTSEGAARTRLARARETFRRTYHQGDPESMEGR